MTLIPSSFGFLNFQANTNQAWLKNYFFTLHFLVGMRSVEIETGALGTLRKFSSVLYTLLYDNLFKAQNFICE